MDQTRTPRRGRPPAPIPPEAVELYRSGVSAYELARRFGVSRSTLLERLRREGCSTRDQRQAASQRWFNRELGGGVRLVEEVEKVAKAAEDNGIEWFLDASCARLNLRQALIELQKWRYESITGSAPEPKLVREYEGHARPIARMLAESARTGRGYAWLLDFVTWSATNDFWSGRGEKHYARWPYLLHLLQSRAVQQFEEWTAKHGPGWHTQAKQAAKAEQAQQKLREFAIGDRLRFPDGTLGLVKSRGRDFLVIERGTPEELADPFGSGDRTRRYKPEELAGCRLESNPFAVVDSKSTVR